MHASSVAVILNPNINRLSPQFHCVFDDFFETVHHKGPGPPPNWDDLMIQSHFKNDYECELDDTWEETSVPPIIPVDSQEPQQMPDNGSSGPLPLPDVSRDPPVQEIPTPEPGTPPVEIPVVSEETPVDTSSPAPSSPPARTEQSDSAPRRSTRVRKPVDRFTPDKAHGYKSIIEYTSMLLKCMCSHHMNSKYYAMNYTSALSMDPVFGVLDELATQPPDFLVTNPWMFKAKKGSDPDSPTIKQALSGPYHGEFLEAMLVKIQELEALGTWTVSKRSEVPSDAHIVPLTWAFCIKR